MERLRFEEFNEKTLYVKLGKLIKLTSIRNKENKVTNVLSVNNRLGFINQAEQFNDRIVASSDVSNYKIIKTDDYAYNPARINVGSIARLKTFEQGIISPMYIVFRTKSELDNNYFDAFLNTLSFKNQMKKNLIGSVRQTLDYKSLSQIKIKLPTLVEQEKIGKFLCYIDTIIKKQQERIESLKKMKNGYLQKLFPKKGENIPEFRFKGFTDTWEQCELGELSKLVTKGTTPLDKSGEGNINFVKVENIDSFSGEISDLSKISIEEHNGYLKRSQLQENDILFSIAGTLGRITSVNKAILPANTNQALAIIRLKEGNLNFLKTALKGKAVEDYIRKNPTVGAQPNLSLEQVKSIIVDYPSEDEQLMLGNYFTKLEKLITLHQRKLELINALKKGYLQRIF